MPLHSMGLGWLVFAVLGGIVGWMVGRVRAQGSTELKL